MPQVLAFAAPATFGIGGSAALITGTGLTLLGAGVSIGSSLLLNSALNAIAGGGSQQPSAQDVARRLTVPTTLPDYRHVYGTCDATGTPVVWLVRGEWLVVCYLFNSRPSALPSASFSLDGRAIPVSGNLLDFAGAGAGGTDAPFSGDMVRFWLGRGDQTTPPQELLTLAPWTAERPDGLKATDGWRGRTVVWARYKFGSAEKAAERWVSVPPLLKVRGAWSRIWNPNDGAQSPTDPSTWTVSDDHRRIVLDALLNNPVRPWPRDQIILSSFVEAQQVASEAVPLASGGSEPRWRAAGTLLYGETAGELEDFLAPLLVSGAADLVRIGGRLGITTGTWAASRETITAPLSEGGLSYSDLLPEDQLINELRVSYLSLNRRTETADLQPWPIPGALAADGGAMRARSLALPFCPSATQAMRVRKIVGLKLRRQKRLGLMAPPEHFDLVASNTATTALPAPFGALNDTYEIASINPALDPLGESGGVAMRIPMELVGPHSSALYAWAASEEEEVLDEPWDGTRQGLQMPGTISAVIEDVSSGSATTQRVRFRLDPSPSSGVVQYEWQTRTGSAPYSESRYIDASARDVAPNSGKVFGLIDGVTSEPRDIRVRAVGQGSAGSSPRSEWREIIDIRPLAVSGGAGTAGLGAATFTGTSPASASATRMRLYRGAPGAPFSGASQQGTDRTVTPGAAFSLVWGDPQANLLSNPGFASTADWIAGTGWSIGSGAATHAAGSASNLSQAETVASDAIVRVGITVVSQGAGTLSLMLIGTTSPAGAAVSGAGRRVATLTAPASMTHVAYRASSGSTAQVDDAAAYVETAGCLPQGEADYWLVPVTSAGAEGTPSGPHRLIIT